MSSPNPQNTTNLLVPAYGGTQAFQLMLPGASGYEVNFQTLQFDLVAFQPQSVTVDATSITSGYVTFSIPLIGFTRYVPGGQSATFNFPAVSPLDVFITPSAGAGAINTIWYNYPSFPDYSGEAGGTGQAVQVTNQPTVIVSGYLPPPAPIENTYAVGALAASASYYGAAIDLGAAATPRQYTACYGYKSGIPSTGESLFLQWSQDGVNWIGAMVGGLLNGYATAYNSNSSGVMTVFGTPIGRYYRIGYTNGSTAQTALNLYATALN